MTFLHGASCAWDNECLDLWSVNLTAGCTASCTTGWVNCANEHSQAALERSSQDAYDVIRLTRSKAAVRTVDDVAHLIEFKKKILFIYFTLGSRWYRGTIKIRSISKLYKTLLCYLFICYMNISSGRLYNRLESVDVLTADCTTGCAARCTTSCKV